jgi:hypothetical protein
METYEVYGQTIGLISTRLPGELELNKIIVVPIKYMRSSEGL